MGFLEYFKTFLSSNFVASNPNFQTVLFIFKRNHHDLGHQSFSVLKIHTNSTALSALPGFPEGVPKWKNFVKKHFPWMVRLEVPSWEVLVILAGY